MLEGCVSFLLDWLIEGQEGYLETNPSTSPEHMFIAPDGKPASVSYSTTMDMSIIKEVFTAIVSAAEVITNNWMLQISLCVYLSRLTEKRNKWTGIGQK